MKTLIILSIYASYAVVYAMFCIIYWVAEELERRRNLKGILAHYNIELDRLEFMPPRIRETKQIKGIVPELLQIERKANIWEWLKATRLTGNCRMSYAYILKNVCSKCGSKVLAIYMTSEYYDWVEIICLGCGNVLWTDCAMMKDPDFPDSDEKPTPVLIKCLLLIFVPIWAPIVLVIYVIYLI